MSGKRDFWAGAPNFMNKWQFLTGAGAILAIGLIVGVVGGMYTNDSVSIDSMGAIEEELIGNTEEMSPIFVGEHPKLYDAGKIAEEFAEGYDIVITSPHAYDADKTELSFKIYGPQYPRGDEMLQGIEIYPRQNNLDLDEAMELAQDYLPLDVVKKWYEQKWSKIYYDYNGGSDLYAQLYVPTTDGKNWIKESGNQYNYVLVLVEMKDGTAQNIILRTTNSMPNTGRGNRTEEWHYSIL